MNMPADQFVAQGTILFVDDEPAILSSLRRLARRQGYQVLVANSGKDGLATLEHESVDVVVSDMRMPEMTGAEFLQKVAQTWPDVQRILLTGFSEIESAIAAVNHGRIFRYLHKPWDDVGLADTLAEAMQLRHLKQEKLRLEALTVEQNEALVTLNRDLEDKVAQRTSELREAADEVANANRELQQAYVNAVEVFSSLIRSGTRRSSASLRQIAEWAHGIGQRMQLPEAQLESLRLAGLLCELGKLSLSDEVKDTPYALLSVEQAGMFRMHPAFAASVLLPLGPLEAVGKILRNHCERLDGSGYPDGLTADQISTSARILSVVKDFDALTNGLLVRQKLTATEALSYLRQHAGEHYDGAAIEHLEAVLVTKNSDALLNEDRSLVAGLRAGMKVMRDVYNDHGVLLLPKGLKLKDSTIDSLIRMNREQKDELVIYVTKES